MGLYYTFKGLFVLLKIYTYNSLIINTYLLKFRFTANFPAANDYVPLLIRSITSDHLNVKRLPD